MLSADSALRLSGSPLSALTLSKLVDALRSPLSARSIGHETAPAGPNSSNQTRC